MRISTFCRSMMIPAIVASTLAGCSGGGTTQDVGASNAPGLTKESLKDAAADINAGAGGMKSPGVMPKK